MKTRILLNPIFDLVIAIFLIISTTAILIYRGDPWLYVPAALSVIAVIFQIPKSLADRAKSKMDHTFYFPVGNYPECVILPINPGAINSLGPFKQFINPLTVINFVNLSGGPAEIDVYFSAIAGETPSVATVKINLHFKNFGASHSLDFPKLGYTDTNRFLNIYNSGNNHVEICLDKTPGTAI